jgi:tetratricopeptide (TPR) repeat protein
LFDQIAAETSPDAKLELVGSFERQFPNSKILSRVYLEATQVYRDQGVREKLIEYGEKVLKLDGTNITAMMLLARNYAIEGKHLDRAIELGQRAVDRLTSSATDPSPVGYSDAQWKAYLRTSQDSAQQILDYAKAMKTRSEAASKEASPSSTTTVADTPAAK